MAGALLQSGTATLIASDTFYGEDRSRFHLPLNFALLDSPWDALWLQAHIDAYLNAIPKDAWRDWVIGGHDKRRVASKVGQAQALRSRHDILVYERAWEGEELLVALNTAHQPRKLDWQGVGNAAPVDLSRWRRPGDGKPGAVARRRRRDRQASGRINQMNR